MPFILLEDGTSFLLQEDAASKFLLESSSVVVGGRGPITSYRVEAAWGQTTGGLFTFGTSTFGGADVLAAASWSQTFTDPLADITGRTRRISITRGRDDFLGSVNAGSCTLSGIDPDGFFNEKNTSSPIANALYTGIPVRVSGVTSAGVLVPLFYGFIDTITSDPAGRRGTFQIACTDFFEKLDAEHPTLGVLNGLTTGSLIGRLLDALGWTDPSLRSLDVGDALPAGFNRADGSRSALAIIQEALASERGFFYVAADGSVTYRSRYNVTGETSAGTIEGVMTGAPVALDQGRVVNRWTVQRALWDDTPAGVAQVRAVPVTDRSYHRYHYRDGSVVSPYLANDDQAANLAAYNLSLTKTPADVAWSINLVPPDYATLDQMLFRELGDRVTLTVAPESMEWPPYTADYTIQQITHTIDTGVVPRHQTSWGVVQSPIVNPFIFGQSVFGGTDVFVY